MSYTVYKHTGPTGKVYIGITLQEPAKRWNNGNGYKHSPHFRAAIERYGWDAFTHEILAAGLAEEAAEALEIEMIALHNSTDRRFGYNADKGGNVGAKHSAATRGKIGAANRERVWAAESRQKLRAYKLEHPTPPEVAARIGAANRGRKHCPESIEKIRAAQAKRPVRDTATGKAYASVQDAARTHGINPSHIISVCKGKRRTAGGRVWAYEEVVT